MSLQAPPKEIWWEDIHMTISSIFDSCQGSDEMWSTKFESFLTEEIPKCYNKLPWLNETPFHHLHSNEVVRFRGMIQDMHDTEFYMDTYVLQTADGSEMMKPGRYTDMISCSPNESVVLDSVKCQTKDRSSYLCISIPGENGWIREIYSNQNPVGKNPVSSTATSDLKRKLPEEDGYLNNGTSTGISMKQNTSDSQSKKVKNSDMEIGSSSLESSHFPLADQSENIACVLKVYSETIELQLNDIVEVVGILFMEPSFPGFENSEDDIEAGCSSSTLLGPRLHVLSLLRKVHCNPLLPSVIERERLSTHSSNVRELIGSIFDVAFLGDELAAEYFICHLISSVYLRQDIMPLGKFSLNISGITPELKDKRYPEQLYSLLESLTTLSYFFPMTLRNMNTLDFIPKKDYQTNCLKSGLLQLPANLHLVIDETELQAGQLDTKGLNNLTALGNLVNWQKVDYDFQFHNLEQLTNVPVLILSEGKSMINCDFHVRLEPQHTDVSLAFSQVSSLLTDSVLEKLRMHLTLSRLAPYSFTGAMQKTIQDDFVSSRRNEGGMTADDLHSLLTLARLLAQGIGQEELTESVWKSAKCLESERKASLKKDHS